MCMHAWLHVCVRVYVCMYHTYVCVCRYGCIHVCACMYVCVNVCIYNNVTSLHTETKMS
jgi:hypothetical protein